MNKRTALVALPIVAVLALGGCSAAAPADSMKATETMKATDSMKPMESGSMKPSDSAKPMGTESPDAMMKSGAYVTLADYQKSMADYVKTSVVYFFHASWCPDCKAADAALTASPSPVPHGVTVVKVDYDTATELKQKYGVTVQDTFVQVDHMGKEVARWSGKPVPEVLAGVRM